MNRQSDFRASYYLAVVVTPIDRWSLLRQRVLTEIIDRLAIEHHGVVVVSRKTSEKLEFEIMLFF